MFALAEKVGVLSSIAKALLVDALGGLVHDLVGQRDGHARGGYAHWDMVLGHTRHLCWQKVALTGACHGEHARMA